MQIIDKFQPYSKKKKKKTLVDVDCFFLFHDNFYYVSHIFKKNLIHERFWNV